MTKKDLLEAIKDMPEDATILIPIDGYSIPTTNIEVVCNFNNEIILRY